VKQLLNWGVFVLVLLGFYLIAGPTSLGGPAAYVIVDGRSMEPTYQDGDLVGLSCLARGADQIFAEEVLAADGLLQVVRVEPDGSRTSLDVPETTVATPYAVDVSADGAFVASAGSGHLQIWRVGDTSLSEPTSVEIADDSSIITATYSPDGSRIVMFDQVGPSLIVYDVAVDPAGDGAGVRLTRSSTIPVNAGYVTFADNDTLVVADDENTIVDDEVAWRLFVWDLTADREIGSVDMGGRHGPRQRAVSDEQFGADADPEFHAI
jgi:hypothetical protein